MTARIIGIDPGMDGALAVVDADGHLEALEDMPTVATRQGKRQVNIPELAHLLRHHGRDATVKLEQVGARPGQGVTSMFNFGMGYGAVQGVIQTLGLPMTLVTPTAWKRAAGIQGTDKDYARTRALQLYPDADLARKKDIGRADALLIARYG
jgi:crossover junction endodeoxyribonuclease RuvC